MFKYLWMIVIGVAALALALASPITALVLIGVGSVSWVLGSSALAWFDHLDDKAADSNDRRERPHRHVSPPPLRHDYNNPPPPPIQTHEPPPPPKD